jgi:hypothetical protein
VDGKGFIKCFRQNQPDQMSLHHGASLRAWYPKGIYGAVPVESHGLMIVSGQVEQEFASQPSVSYFICNESLCVCQPLVLFIGFS